MPIDKKSAIDEIKALETLYLQCRSVYPALTDSIIGHNDFSTSPYYIKRGFIAHIRYLYVQQAGKRAHSVSENEFLMIDELF